jgi:hypothetical protein
VTTATALDERDAAILADRTAALDAVDGPRCGDYLRMPDGELLRVAHVFPADWEDMHGVQPNCPRHGGEGSFYLGRGYVSYSGSLDPRIDQDRLTLSDETRNGSAWFFHHDHMQAHNGVTVSIPFRVYDVAPPA